MEHFSALPLFVTVVECGSFSAAGSKLGISKSAVSKRISQLEIGLGAQLLYRTTRSLSLTEAGERYYDSARQAVRFAREGEDAISELQQAPKGLLRVTVPMVFGRRHIAPVIPEFLRRYPGIRLQLAMDDGQTDLIAEGLDLAVRIGELEDSSLVAKRLAPCLSRLCAAPSYLAEHGTPSTPADLAKHNCLFYSLFRGGSEWRFLGPEGEVRIEPKGNFEVNNSDAIHSVLLDGLGIANMPEFIVGDDLRSGRLVPLLSGYALPPHGIYCVYPKRKHLPAKVSALVAFLAEKLGDGSMA
ncbi:LysR family transcriptional regulator [Shewanella sp. AS16]|uniref:LysR family transcriptional regulator n=1 Tax=Shewanella sp. AS16 TaxID=2907625 RepID=UPI001F2F139F|nr:LysR family transcriptional regulator [Shewanella sp. AS16]MCE9687917.1 LysR family transcriptional regulator [Shewanella sp. AS16]